MPPDRRAMNEGALLPTRLETKIRDELCRPWRAGQQLQNLKVRVLNFKKRVSNVEPTQWHLLIVHPVCWYTRKVIRDYGRTCEARR